MTLPLTPLSFSFLFFFWRFLGSYVSFSFQFTFDLATSWKRLASFSLSPQRRFSPSFRPRSTTLSVTFSFQRSSLKPLPYATRFLDETFYPRIPDSIREISDPFRIFFRILSRNQGITSEKIVEILKNYIYIHIIESLNKVIELKRKKYSMKLFEDNFETNMEWNMNIRSKEKFLKNLYPFEKPDKRYFFNFSFEHLSNAIINL